MSYHKLRDAVRLTGLHPNTLRKYADQGIIPSIRTPSGQRLFEIEAFVGQRQIAYLKGKEPNAEVVTDIASGLNFKRKGLLSLLERSVRGDKLTVVVAHRDRLARFGFELIEWLIQQNGGSIVVLSKSHHTSPTDELVQDLLAVLGTFAARMPGLGKYRDQIAQDTTLSDSSAEDDVS